MDGQNDIQPALRAKRGYSLKPRRIVLLAFDGVEPVDLAGPSSVFGRAERIRPGSYDIVHASSSGAEVRSASGLGLSGLTPVKKLRGDIDTILIAGGEEAGLRSVVFDDRLPDWLNRRAPRIRRIGSICTGAFVLAAAGLLDGRRAVTHWGSCDLLARLRPAIDVVPDAIYIIDGPIHTSAGVTAGIDLSLAMVEQDLGHAVAARIAREMVLFLRRPGGQSQFSQSLAAQSTAGGVFSDLVAWIVDHPGSDLGIPALARRAGMSERTFVRRFRQETGSTPARLVRSVRVDCARRWLETTAWPVKRISEKAGFGSEDGLVRAFRAELNTTPGSVRAGFSSLRRKTAGVS